MFKIFNRNSRLLHDIGTIFLEENVDSIANRGRHLINSSTGRLSICLKGSRSQEKQNTAHTVLYDNEWNFDPNNWRHLVLTFGFKDELSETLFQRENLALLRVRWWFKILWSVIWTKSHLFSIRKYRSALSVPSGVCRGIQTFTSVRYNHLVPKTRHSH